MVQPIKGMTPMTQTVMVAMMNVAIVPLIRLDVDRMRTGSAKDTPTRIPKTAFSTMDFTKQNTKKTQKKQNKKKNTRQNKNRTKQKSKNFFYKHIMIDIYSFTEETLKKLY